MDAIMIGAMGMTVIEEYFFGRVVIDVFQNAHCPVFAIRSLYSNNKNRSFSP
jgi:nucleotide-binding universal stress UspA family protein